MNISYLNNLFAYNSWAWDRVFASLEQLTDARYKEARPYFWGSLHSLALHSLSAEWIWMQRLQGASPSALFDDSDYADFPAVKEQWLPVREEWAILIHSLNSADLDRPVDYRNTRGNGFTLPLGDVVLHVLNHATEHRSQMTPILYELGVATKPLDYMRFCLRP